MDRTSEATGRVALLCPLAMYPVASLLMAVQGWWVGNLEALFAAPITGMLFTLLNYPVAVVVLWLTPRCSSSRPGLFVLSSVGLALAGYFALVAPLDLLRLPAAFLSVIVATGALMSALLYLKTLRDVRKD